MASGRVEDDWCGAEGQQGGLECRQTLPDCEEMRVMPFWGKNLLFGVSKKRSDRLLMLLRDKQ